MALGFGKPAQLNRGDKVWRVVECDQGGWESWKLVSRLVKVSSNKVIYLDGFFPGMAKANFERRALGRVFFATEQEAVMAFAQSAQEGIESAKQAIERYAREKNWVAKWTKETHQNLGGVS